jgi:alpha-D-ribose 1-methylphosphonate 5-triphosphate synthase subunit PhnG
MLQRFDSHEAENQPDRKEWMALLSRAPQEMLERSVGVHLKNRHHWLRPPEIGLMMVQGRVGGDGEKFNLGEITVTRCALKLKEDAFAHVGVAYVLGRNHQRAKLAAIADALLQDPQQRTLLEASLLMPVREHLKQLEATRQQQAQTTKVDFLTVAREAGVDDGEGEE